MQAQVRRAPAPEPASDPASKSVSFETLARRAEAARAESRFEDAIPLYRRALALRPQWAEGWWSLGTVAYELEDYGAARDALAHLLALKPGDAGGHAFKGLAEFNLKNYDAAYRDLVEARSLGLGDQQAIVDVVRYHAGILASRAGQFEHALLILQEFVHDGTESPRLIEALGIATLRKAILPAELTGTDREPVLMAGRASYFAAARAMAAAGAAFDVLVARFPDVANVHYARGVFLLKENPDEALRAFERELARSPSHLFAMLQLAAEHIRRSDFAGAERWAKHAAEASPDHFVGRKLYGEALLERGDVAAALRELEAAVALAPDSPAVRFTLARAYQRAGRAADADREQAEFTRLDRLLREQHSGTQSLGGVEFDTAPGRLGKPMPE